MEKQNTKEIDIMNGQNEEMKASPKAATPEDYENDMYFHGLARYGITNEMDVELRTRFTHHSPDQKSTIPGPTQVDRYEAIRREARKLAEGICVMTPPSREQALALTKLEEAVMWANAAIARNE